MDYKKNYINDLESLLNESMSPKEFRKKYIDGPNPIDIEVVTNGEIPDLTHILGHYVTDEDVRKKDPQYKKMQNDALAEIIKILKTEGSNNELLKIVMWNVWSLKK